MTKPDAGLLRHLRLPSATGLVIASMIGAGIFTTTGFQAAALGHPAYIFSLWIVGGALAFCGALAFAELGAALPRAGAEYVYIRESFGPLLAFISAFVALFAGFSAPIAAALKVLVEYLRHFVPLFESNPSLVGGVTLNDLAAVAIAWTLVGLHAWGARRGMRFSDAITALKVFGIVLIILAAFSLGDGSAANFTYVSESYYELSLLDRYSAVATSLIFVTFCYMGWNGAAYMAAEMPEPQRTLPRSLMLGTALVTLLYVLLNGVFFYAGNADVLAGHPDVGLVAAQGLFGSTGISLVTAVMAVSILASASAMTALGPRVYYAFGQDFARLSILARADEATGAPRPALILQGLVTTAIIFSGRIDQILIYAGFTLTLFSSLAVACVVVLRRRRPELERPFRVPLYPAPIVLYLAVSVWTLVWAVRGRPIESLLALLTAVVGGGFFYLMRGRGRTAAE